MDVRIAEGGVVMKMKIIVIKKLVDLVLSALKKIEEEIEEAIKIMKTITLTILILQYLTTQSQTLDHRELLGVQFKTIVL